MWNYKDDDEDKYASKEFDQIIHNQNIDEEYRDEFYEIFLKEFEKKVSYYKETYQRKEHTILFMSNFMNNLKNSQHTRKYDKERYLCLGDHLAGIFFMIEYIINHVEEFETGAVVYHNAEDIAKKSAEILKDWDIKLKHSYIDKWIEQNLKRTKDKDVRKLLNFILRTYK